MGVYQSCYSNVTNIIPYHLGIHKIGVGIRSLIILYNNDYVEYVLVCYMLDLLCGHILKLPHLKYGSKTCDDNLCDF